MGFYLRKSVKVGPLRFNLSKSGVGVSAGIKGLRFGAGPRGNYVHMGRHGLYYRATLPTSRAATPRTVSQPNLPVTSQPETLTPVESGSIEQMVDASSADLLAEINAKQQRWRKWPWVFAGFLLASGPVSSIAQQPGLVGPVTATLFVVAWIVCTWTAYRHDVLSKTTVLFYNIEDEANERYQRLHDAFNEFAKCNGRWQIEARGKTEDWKHQAGASHLVRRKSVALGIEPPHDIKTNIAVPSVPFGRETFYLFPDRLLVLSSKGAGAVSYNDLKVEVIPQRFIESERVPSDAKVVGQTWKYVNKSGGPDKRFKDNRQLPVVLYEQVAFSSASGLNGVLQLSRIGVGEPFRVAMTALASTPAVAHAER